MNIIFIGANNPETARMMHAVKEKDEDVSFLGFIDNDPEKKGQRFLGLPVFGGFEVVKKFIKKGNYFVNLITRDCVTRFETSYEISKMGGQFANFIHPSVNLEMVRMGTGNYIQEGVILQADVTIGDNSSIHMGSLIGHESSIGHSVFIAHGCNISGLVKIEDGVFIGTGVTVIPRLRIGTFSLIGAGAVIIKDIPAYSVVVGNPGKVIKRVKTNYKNGNITAKKHR